MPFDKERYEAEYLRKQDRKRPLREDDLVQRYAIDLSASEAVIAEQVRDIRKAWNGSWKSTRVVPIIQQCRAADERLKAQYGESMLRKAFWTDQAKAKAESSEKMVGELGEQLKAAHAQLGVISQVGITAAADDYGLTPHEVESAAKAAGLRVLAPRKLPESPIGKGQFGKLEDNLQVCGAHTVPGLLYPDLGEFRILEGFQSVADGSLCLDLLRVTACLDEAQKLPPGPTNDAKREALRILKTADAQGSDLSQVTLAHLVDLAKDAAPRGIGAVLALMLSLKVERADAAEIAALVAEERNPSGAASKVQVDRLLGEGNLAQAHQLAQAIPEANKDERAAAIDAVKEARARLDVLIAEIRAAVDTGNETEAASRVTMARAISVEDADELLASVPLAPVTGLRLVGDEDQVKLVWLPNTGHGEGTTYVVRRSESIPPSSPADGIEVASTDQVTAVDPHSPVAHPAHYSVFAMAPRRPSSRATSDSITVLPPVSNAEAEVGSSDLTVHWATHPACSVVEVRRTDPRQSPVDLEPSQNSVRLTGLPEGVPVHIELVAVYRTQAGEVLRSAVTHVDAIPRSAAKPLERVRARPVMASGGEARVRVSWNPVDHSEVRIRRSSSPSPWTPGTWISQDELAHYGTELSGSRGNGGGEASIEADLDPGIHHLVAISIGGTGIVVGASTAVGVTDPVRNPTATVFGSYATLSWEWPTSASIVEVHWQRDDDQDVFEISKDDYARGGGAKVPLGRSACKVELRALIRTDAGSFASAPVSLVVGDGEVAEVRYRVTSAGIGGLGGRSKKLTFLSEHGCSGIQIRAIASPGPAKPMSADGKTVLLDQRLDLQPGKPAEYKFSVPKSISKPYWVRCFVVGGDATLFDPPPTELKD